MHCPNSTKERRGQATLPIHSATLPSVAVRSPRSLSETRLSDKHYRHCCGNDPENKERGLDPDWIAANCYSVDAKEATRLLGYRAKSGGIVISGANGQYQFRPDRPWSDKQGKKAPKYRTALGDEYDALLPAHPFEKNYWHDLEALKARCWQIDGHPYLLLTEGGFKAIVACFHELPCIALLGVEMGLTPAAADPQGKRYLVESLERFARAGFGFILAFDADIATKEAVRLALHKLGHQLKKFNVPVRVLPAWDENLGKGIDDYIQMNSIEEFRQHLLERAILFSDWIGTAAEGETPKRPDGYPVAWGASPIADWLVGRYRDRLAWDGSIQEWRRYGARDEGIWSIELVECVRQVICAELEGLQPFYTVVKGGEPRIPIFGDRLIRDIEALMKYKLIVPEWDSPGELLPLTNGVLDLESRKLLPHSPDYRLTWCLPYQYNPLALCDPIRNWLLEMCEGEEGMVQLLRAYLHGIVTGRTDWQKYLELLGPGGTGKSTYIRLAMALVGARNFHTTNLKKLENGSFETANLKDKRLVVITDSERYTGSVSTLKALTGGDPLPYEKKFKQATGGFTPRAMVLVAANETIQSGDYTSGLERRRISVPMSRIVGEEEQKQLLEYRDGKIVGEFAPYIPGLLNWVLAMTEEEATAAVRGYRKLAARLNEMKARSLVETNPIADWLDHAVVYCPDYRTAVGVAKRDKDPGSEDSYRNIDRWLYANYAAYCQDTGTKTLGLRRFVNLLDDLVVNQLKLKVSHGRDRDGAYFLGLKLRTPEDNDPPLITGESPPGGEKGRPPEGYSGRSSSVVMDSVTERVMAETRAGDGCDGCDGYSLIKLEEKNKHQRSMIDVENTGGGNAGFVPSHPSQRSGETLAGDGLQPLPHPSHNPSQNRPCDGIDPSQAGSETAIETVQETVTEAVTLDRDGLQPLAENAATATANPTPKVNESSAATLDYSTYPHRTSNDIRAKKKRAGKCKEGMLACTNKEELARFKSEAGFSEAEIKWVYRHALTPAQREKVKGAADCNQLNLLERFFLDWDDLVAAIDAELARLGWTVEVARDHLARTYGVKSRLQLSDEQVIEFWEYLKGR